MTETLGYIHGLLQHDDAEGDSRDPADETDNAEDAEEGENHGCRVVMTIEVVDTCPDTECNVQNPGDPDELLGESSRSGKISPGKDEGDR